MPRVAPRAFTAGPRVSWCSGKRVGREWYVGLFTDRGVDPDLDRAAGAANWQAAEMQHMGGRVGAHWLLPSPAWVYVLIEAVPWESMAGMVSNDVSGYGIGARWPSGQPSALGVHVLFRDLLVRDYREPLVFTVTSRSTDDLLAVLLAHNQLLDRYEAATEATGARQALEYWQVALPIVPGREENKGKGDKVTSITTVGHAHPDPPTFGYVRSNTAPPVVAGVWQMREAEIKSWAARFAQGGDRSDQ